MAVPYLLRTLLLRSDDESVRSLALKLVCEPPSLWEPRDHCDGDTDRSFREGFEADSMAQVRAQKKGTKEYREAQLQTALQHRKYRGSKP